MHVQSTRTVSGYLAALDRIHERLSCQHEAMGRNLDTWFDVNDLTGGPLRRYADWLDRDAAILARIASELRALNPPVRSNQ